MVNVEALETMQDLIEIIKMEIHKEASKRTLKNQWIAVQMTETLMI